MIYEFNEQFEIKFEIFFLQKADIYSEPETLSHNESFLIHSTVVSNKK